MKQSTRDNISYLACSACILAGIIYQNVININIGIGYLILNKLKKINKKQR